MACRLFGAKPLSEPMLVYCQLNLQEQTSVKFESEFYHFHSKQCIWNCRLPKWRPFCPGWDQLIRVTCNYSILCGPSHWWDGTTHLPHSALRNMVVIKNIIPIHIISVTFYGWNPWCIHWNFIQLCSLGSHWWVFRIGFSNGMIQCWLICSMTLQWRHNEHDGISNHLHLPCLLNCWFRCRSKKTSKFRVTGLCMGNSPVTSEFPTQKASNTENVSIWWHHHKI